MQSKTDYLVEIKACELQEGDSIDMEATKFPFKYFDSLMEFEYAHVDSIELENDNCLLIEFSNMACVAVGPNQYLQILNREIR